MQILYDFDGITGDLRLELQKFAVAELPKNLFAVSPPSTVVVDLSHCDYLDSTFLGCLLGLHRQYGTTRLRIAAPPDRTRKLFGPTKLDIALRVTADVPPVLGDYVAIAPEAINSQDMARHIMECHRRLAEIACS